MLRPIRSFTPSIRVSLIVGLVLLAFAVVPHLLLAAPAAPSLHVDNNLDFSGGACLTLTLGDCSLRSAIQIANVNPNVTILFDGDYTITLGSSLVITGSSMTITNSGVRDIRVDANSLGSAFLISGSDVTIDGLHMHGAATDYPNLWITGSAVHVRITKNEIGGSGSALAPPRDFQRIRRRF